MGETETLILDGKNIEEIVFDGTDLEKTVTNHATNALIVKEFMEESIKDPNGVLHVVELLADVRSRRFEHSLFEPGFESVADRGKELDEPFDVVVYPGEVDGAVD